MGFYMLFEILGPLEGFPTKVTFMRLQGHMDTDVRGDMISFDHSGTTPTPVAGEVKIVGALATNMAFADMLLLI